MPYPPNVVNWYGGKQKLARQIISVFPEHRHYVEVFFGGGAVFFNKPKAQMNTVNDFNGNLVNLYTQIRDNFDELSEMVYWTLYSREEYEKFTAELKLNELVNIPPVKRALAYLLVIKCSFSGMVGTGFSASIQSNSATFTLDLIHRMRAAREKLDGVVVENKSFEEIIAKYSSTKDALTYLDPPYWITMVQKSYYEKTLSHNQHLMLAGALKQAKSPWVLSYDDLPEVVDLYSEYNLMRLSVAYAFGAEDKSRRVTELLITNYKAPRPQLDIFDEAKGKVEADEVTDEERDAAIKAIRLKHEVEQEEQLKRERDQEMERRNVIATGNQPKFTQDSLFSN